MSERPFLAAEIGGACLCLNVQRAGRALARRYDAAFRSHGLTSGQFAILAALDWPTPLALVELARRLGVERTTLTRNLAPLLAAGLVSATVADGDRRQRDTMLTPAGRAKLIAALPAWRAAQERSVAALPDAEWPAIRRALATLGDI